MKAILKCVRKAIRSAGWDLHRTTDRRYSRPTMEGALAWMGRSRIPIRTVLDVGASNGCWSAEAMRHLAADRYVLFEPQEVHGRELADFRAGSPKQVDVVAKAVGAEVGVTYFDASTPRGGALMTQPGANVIEVPVTTIDSEVAGLGATGPFLLKLDTHGYEPGILRGSEQTLEASSALIIESYNFRIAEGCLLFWELCALLDAQGFRCVDLVDVLHRDRDLAFWQMDLVFIRKTWPGFEINSYQ